MYSRPPEFSWLVRNNALLLSDTSKPVKELNVEDESQTVLSLLPYSLKLLGFPAVIRIRQLYIFLKSRFLDAFDIKLENVVTRKRSFFSRHEMCWVYSGVQRWS